MLKNSQTYFKNLAIFTPQDFKVCLAIFQHYEIYFSASNVSVKVQKKEETREIKMQRDILGKLVRSYFDTNSYINVENLSAYPPGPVSLASSCLDGTSR